MGRMQSSLRRTLLVAASIAILLAARPVLSRDTPPDLTAAATAQDLDEYLIRHQVRPCWVIINCSFRLGNQLSALLYGVYTAKLLGAKLQATRQCYSGMFDNGEEKLELDFTAAGYATATTSGGCDGNVTVDVWGLQPGFNPTSEDWDATAKLIKPVMIPSDDDQLAEHDMDAELRTVVYLRAGDIFNPRPHRLYTQAPCVYFTMVLDELLPPGSDGRHLSIVTFYGDTQRQNPCTKMLLERYPAARNESRDVFHDWWETANARNLVLPGATTFGLSSALLSSRVKNVFLPSWSPNDLRYSLMDGTLHMDSSEIYHPESSTSIPWFFFLPEMPTFLTHRYLVHDWTTKWNGGMFPKMLSHPKELVTKIPTSVVHRIEPAVATQSLTLILSCIGKSPFNLASIINRLWWPFPPYVKQKYIPIIAFVPEGWAADVLRRIKPPGKYYAVFLEDTSTPSNLKLLPSDWNNATGRFVKTREGYCLTPQVRSLLQVMRTNPFQSTHVVWSYEKKPENIPKLYEKLVFKLKHTSAITTHGSNGASLKEGATDFAASRGYLVAPTRSPSLTRNLAASTYLPRQRTTIQQFCKSALFNAECARMSEQPQEA